MKEIGANGITFLALAYTMRHIIYININMIEIVTDSD